MSLSVDEVHMLSQVMFTPPVPVWMSDLEHCRVLASEVHQYLTQRAAREGVGFELDVEFFAAAMHRGIGSMFGVSCCWMGVFCDTQEPTPGFLDAYLQRHETSLVQQEEYAIGARCDTCSDTV